MIPEAVSLPSTTLRAIEDNSILIPIVDLPHNDNFKGEN